MKLNLNDLNPGTWFKFDEGDPGSGSICLRILNAGKLAEIRDKTVTTKVEYHGENRFEYQNMDNAARDNIIWDYCIVDWKDLVDDEEKPIECNTENKIKLMNEHVGFSLLVEALLGKLNKLNDVHTERLEKNLSSTPGQD